MFNSIKLYRWAHWLYLHHIPILPKFFQAIIFFFYNCRIPYKAKIGKGTYCSHGGIGVTVHPDAVIGENCVLGYCCHIAGQKPYRKVAQIGNNVYICPGAVIQGPVIIEDNVIIGTNAVVLKSVPAYSIVAGVPAKIVGDVRNLKYDFFSGSERIDGIKDFMKKDNQ